jgi:hypothetical protein
MKRFLVILTAWAMGLTGVLASVALPAGAASAVAPSLVSAVPAGSYTPLAMSRVFSGNVTTATQLVPIALRGGVPSDATAVMMNVQVSNPTAAGYVRVTPVGSTAGVATQEFVKGQQISNLVAVKLVGGKVQAQVSAGSALVHFDVTGYYSPNAGSAYTPLPMLRVYSHPATTALLPVKLAGLGGVPSGATAVMMNVQVSNPTAAGYVRVTPFGADAAVATQEFVKGQQISNLVAVKLVGGKVQMKVSAGSALVHFDVTGYYSPNASSRYTPLPMLRVYSHTATTTALPVTLGGAPLGGVPADATAVMMNVQVSNPTAAGYVRVTPFGADAAVATQEFVKGQQISNLVAVKLVGGKVQMKVSAGSALVHMDVTGYYSAAPKPPDAVTTTTALAVSPATAVAPAKATLTATVTGAGAAGTVEFFNGTASLGTSPVALGVATKALTAIAAGNYSYHAVFTPTSLLLFSASTSGATAFTVTSAPVPVITTTTLAVTPASPVGAPANPTLTASVTGAGAAGTVEFFNGTASLGTSPVALGLATKALTGVPVGSYSYHAVFTPTSLLLFSASTSTATPYVVTDITAPASVTGLVATVLSDTSIKLDWVNPTDPDFTGVTVRRLQGATAPATVNDGDPVLVPTSATATSFTDTVLLGRQYSYAVFAHDGVPNFAAADTVIATSTSFLRPSAVLSINNSQGLTAKTSVGGFTPSFDLLGSLSGLGETLTSASLDYGDGTPPQLFSGDPTTWVSNHDYTTVGDKTVRAVVTNSAGLTGTDTVTLTVYPLPTATITARGGPFKPGQEITFDVNAITPPGTAITDYDTCFDGLSTGPIWSYLNGAPPATLTHTFAADGIYDAEFYVYNDADGWVMATVQVRVDSTPTAPVTALTATSKTGSIALAWTNPTDADFAGVTIRRAVGATPPLTAADGTSVPVPASATATSYTDTGVTVGTQYSYAVFAHDGSGNFAGAANVTLKVAAAPIAALSVNGSTSGIVKTSVGGYTPLFDLTGSKAGVGNLVSAVLDYGDGTTKSFTGDPATWSSSHDYATTGDVVVTAVVTNSSGDTATAMVNVTVFGLATATITPPGNGIARPGAPVIFALTTSTPPGTGFTDYDVSYDNGLTWVYVSDVPPTTLTHTFSAEGTYTVLFVGYNDADGFVRASAQLRVDVTPPVPVSNLSVSILSVGDNFLSLSWTNPTDADFTGVMIRRLAGATAPATISDGTLVRDFNDPANYVVDAGLTAGTQYSYAVFAHDGSGNFATGVNVTSTTTGTPPHLVPPGLVTGLAATVLSDNSVKLDWVNPSDADFAGVTIRRADGPIAPASPTAGDEITVPASATATSFTDTGLIAGTEYSYAVFAYDTSNNHAAGVNVTKTTTVSTTAVLLIDSNRVTVGTELIFDPSLSYAATGASLTGTLDFGDATPVESYSGDPATWASFHTYDTTGAKTVTLTVTDSAEKTLTQVVTINVYDPPTAAIPATGEAQVGVPFTFPITATTPAGTAFMSWQLYGDFIAGGYNAGPPVSLNHTFDVAGTYTFTLTVSNDAQGTAASSEMVVTVR